jgi:AraC-like DNA-binding protein
MKAFTLSPKPKGRSRVAVNLRNPQSRKHRDIPTNRDGGRTPLSFHHYLPIGDEIFHDGFYITSGGSGTILPGQRYPVGTHPQLYAFDWREGRILPDFAVILIASGSGTFQQRGEREMPVSKGAVILLFPGVWHRYRPNPSEGWTEKWFQFNGEFAHRLRERGLISPKTPLLRPGRVKEIERKLDHLLQRIHRNPTVNSLILSLEAQEILSQLLGAEAEAPVRPASRPPPGDAMVARALGYIWAHNHRTISVADVAEHVGLNRRTLERRFAAHLGQSVLEQIIQCRFNRAERLLRETDLPIKAIVGLSGFGTEENMRKTFVTRLKASPRSYRRLRQATSEERADAIPRVARRGVSHPISY